MDINLVLFSTTQGHKGRDTYQETASSLFSKIDRSFFKGAFAHIKNTDQKKCDEMVANYSDMGIRTFVSNGQLVHHSQNHAFWSKEYYKDVFRMVSESVIRKEKYFFWLEDDWVLRNKKDLREIFEESLNFLEDDPDTICVRFLSESEVTDDRPDWFKDIFHEKGEIFKQGLKFTKWGPVHPFGPSILKTEQVFGAWNLVMRNMHILDYEHCELVATQILKQFSTSTTPFAFYNKDLIYSHHIG